MDNTPRIMYSYTLLKQLTSDIDKKVIQFYNIHEGENKYFQESFYDLCVGIWMDTVNGKINQSELLKIRRSFMFQRKRKKRRWYESIQMSVQTYSIDDKKHPFFFIIESKKHLDFDIWNSLYGGRSIREIIEYKLEETKEWLENENAFMIECPALNSFTPKKVFDAFSSDVVFCMFETADAKYNLKLNEFTEAYIDEMGNAYFTDSKRKYDRPLQGPLEKEIWLSESGDKKMFMSISQEAFGSDNALSTSLFDEKDQKLLMYITRNAADSAASSKIALSASSLTKAMLGKHTNHNLSSKNYADMERHLYKIAGTTFTKFEDGKQVAAINFLGSVTKMNRNGQIQYDITLGPIISDAIIGNQIRRLPSSTFESIQSATGRILLLSLQKERIKAFGRYKDRIIGECVTQFSYSNFLAMINFSTNNKSKNWKLIKETLLEFKQKRIFIDRVFYDNVSYIAVVYWIPLSNDELHDLSFFGYLPIIENEE